MKRRTRTHLAAPVLVMLAAATPTVAGASGEFWWASGTQGVVAAGGAEAAEAAIEALRGGGTAVLRFSRERLGRGARAASQDQGEESRGEKTGNCGLTFPMNLHEISSELGRTHVKFLKSWLSG